MSTAIPTASASFDQAMFVAGQKGKALPKVSTDIKKMEQIDKTAKDFEAVFLSEMMTYMFQGVKTDESFGGGYGEEMFRSTLINQYSTQMVAKGGIGLADSIKEQMIKMQEAQQNQPSN